MSTWYLKSSAILLILGALLGIFLAVGGTLYLWGNENRLNSQVTRGLDLIDNTLETSAEGLELLNQSLLRTTSTIALLKETSDELSSSLDSTIPIVEQMGTMIGEDMTTVVRDTQASLSSAQSSARLVDDTLRIITSLPLIGQRYAPALPLGESIGNVTESLEGLPDSFRDIQHQMNTAAGQLETIQSEVESLAENITEAENSITEAQGVIGEYESQVSTLQERMAGIRQNFPRWIRSFNWGITLFLIWMAIAQVGLINQALSQIRRPS